MAGLRDVAIVGAETIRPDTLRAFATTARLRFGQALDRLGGLNPRQRDDALRTFR